MISHDLSHTHIHVEPCRPAVDAIVISHNHYDHLDTNTVRALLKAQPNAVFFVPLGMKSWFASVALVGKVPHFAPWILPFVHSRFCVCLRLLFDPTPNFCPLSSGWQSSWLAIEDVI
jgi:hypothetical protein